MTEDEFDRAWRVLAPAAAHADEGVTKEILLARLENGSARMWCLDDTYVVTAENGDVVRIGLCGGSLEAAIQIKDAIEDDARARGYKRSEIFGRLGWERIFRDYQKTAVLLKKDL